MFNNQDREFFLVDDHFLYYWYLYVCFRGDTVRRGLDASHSEGVKGFFVLQ